jgi:ligand-binding sensor domain-containing protein
MKNSGVFKYSFHAIFLILFLYSSHAIAVKFYSINSLFGISSRVTNSICKDDNGFIWASSKTGVLRLTDNGYRIYQLPYDTVGVLSVNLIHQSSRLVAYTNYGQVFEYNAVYDRFELLVNLSKKVDQENFYMYSFLLDNQGNYWIAVGSGIYKYEEGKLQLVYKWPTQGYYSMTWYNDQNIVIAKPESLWLLNTQTLAIKCINESLDVNKFFVSSFFLDKNQQTLWMGTYSNGLFCYHFNTNKLVHVLDAKIPKQPILAIEAVSDSTLLIGIDGQGVWEVSKSGRQVLNVYKDNPDVLHSLRGNGVYDIFYEEGKRVWVCTISGGVSFYEIASPLVNQLVHQAYNSNSLVDNDVNYILEDSEGKLWFATNNGISNYNPKNGIWKNLYSNKLEHSQVFLSLCEDNDGRIWAGTYSSGVYVLDKNTGRELAHYFSEDKEFSEVTKFIFDIFKDSDGDIWIGGINGKFVCFDSKSKTFRTYSNESISSFNELTPTQILLGCSSGLKLLNKHTGNIINILNDCVVQDFHVIGDVVWVATSGGGLLEYHLKNNRLRKFTTKDGLPSDFLNSIVYADQHIWLGTENGICRFNPETMAICTFSSVHPLSGISYNKSALSKLKDGQLAFGTNNGALLFAPETIIAYSSKGKIFLQDFTITGQSIRDLPSYELKQPVDSIEAIVLNYSQNTFSIELISILMQSDSKFAWKLDGFDKEWSTPTDNRIITYTNIPSGKYKLMIRLFDSSLMNAIDERSISISVIPPFWQKGWFWFLIITFVSGVIILSFLYYINRLNQQHTIEKVRFFTNTAHDIRTSLTLLKAPVEELNKEGNLTEKGRYYLGLAIDQARQLSTVVTQLIDFSESRYRKGASHVDRCRFG